MRHARLHTDGGRPPNGGRRGAPRWPIWRPLLQRITKRWFITPLLAALLAAALDIGRAVDPDAAGSLLTYSVRFDEATGSAALSCDGSSTGSCTFWFGDGQVDSAHAAGSGTLAVGSAPAIVRVSAPHAAYCVGVDADTPPRWPECTHGPLGGALDRTKTVDYRRH